MPEELGDQPEPIAEPPERFPGGVDAIADEEKYGDIPDEPVIPDVRAAKNPALDEVPDELEESEAGKQDPRPDGERHPERDVPA